MGLLQQLFSSDFMPHGVCYLWDPRILLAACRRRWADRPLVLLHPDYCIPLTVLASRPLTAIAPTLRNLVTARHGNAFADEFFAQATAALMSFFQQLLPLDFMPYGSPLPVGSANRVAARNF